MAAVHIWETSKIELRAEYGGKKNKTCQFKFYEGTKVVKAVDAKLSGVVSRSWKGEWKTRACETDELFYVVTVKVLFDGVEKPDYEREYRVFADTITIAAELIGTGPLADAQFELAQLDPAGKNKSVALDRKTGEDGKLTLDLVYPNTVTLKWRRPWVIDHWDNETSRKPKAHLNRAFVAKLVFPDPTADPDPDPRPDPKTPRQHVQWVNMAYESTKPNQGSKIAIKVGAKDPDKAEPGDRVYLKATFAETNSKRAREPEGHDPGKVVELESVLGDDKTARFQIELGPAGGDAVAIEVGGLRGVKDDDVAIVNWRMLYHDLCAPDTIALEDAPKLGGGTAKGFPAAARSWYDAQLAKGFVAYMLRGSSVAAATTEPYRSSMYPREYVGLTAGPAELYIMGFADTRPSTWGSGDRRCMKVVVCDRAFAADDSKTPYTETVTLDKSPFSFSVYDAHKEYVFERRMGSTGGDAIVPLTWHAVVDPKAVPETHPGLDSSGKPRNGTVSRSWINASNMAWLKITLPPEIASFVGAASDTKCPVVVKFTVRTAFEINGSAAGVEQTMVFKGDKPAAMACTICHELAHSMGLTVFGSGPYKRPPPAGIKSPKAVPKGTMYTGKGHTGSHCADGLSDDERKLASYGDVTSGKCIMFGSGGEDPPRRTKFCDTCLEILIARRLDDLASRWADRKKAAL